MCTDGSHALSFASPITRSLIFIQSVEVTDWENHSKLNVPTLHIPARLIINTKLEEACSSISSESIKCVGTLNQGACSSEKLYYLPSLSLLLVASITRFDKVVVLAGQVSISESQ